MRMITSADAARHLVRQQTLQRIAIGVLILVCIEVLNQFLIASGSALANALQTGTSNSRFWVGVYQQFVQAAAGILLYRFFFQNDVRQLGINLKNKSVSFRYFGNFALAWLTVIVLYLTSSSFIFPNAWAAMTTASLPPANTIAATLFFQAIFPGMGEEILFRGLILSLLTTWVFPRHARHTASQIGVIALSSAYFAAAHIYFSLAPLQITHFDTIQIVTALACGVAYAMMYLETQSLLAPFLAHNFANTTATICGYLIATL